MTPPRSPARNAIEAVLADGDRHSRDQLLEAAARAVPPGRAWRAAERERRSKQRARRGSGLGETARQRGDQDQVIAAGARRIASDALASAVRNGAALRLADGTYQTTTAALTGGSSPCTTGA